MWECWISRGVRTLLKLSTVRHLPPWPPEQVVILTAFVLTVDQVANAGGFEALVVDTGSWGGMGWGVARQAGNAAVRWVCIFGLRDSIRGSQQLQAAWLWAAWLGLSASYPSMTSCLPPHPHACSCAAGRVVSGTYGQRVALHESGHFLVAYLLGLLPKGYSLSSLDLFLR